MVVFVQNAMLLGGVQLSSVWHKNLFYLHYKYYDSHFAAIGDDEEM